MLWCMAALQHGPGWTDSCIGPHCARPIRAVQSAAPIHTSKALHIPRSVPLSPSLSLTTVQEAPRGSTPALTAQFSFHNARNWIFLLYHDVLLHEFCSPLVQQRQVRYDIGRSCREQGHLRIQTVIISQLSYPSLQKIIRFFFPFFVEGGERFFGTCVQIRRAR